MKFDYKIDHGIIKQIITKLSNGRARGFDGSLYEMFKYGYGDCLNKIISWILENMIIYGGHTTFL